MIDTSELRGYIAKKGKSQRQVAKHLKMSTNTFYGKMNRASFGSEEIDGMVEYLEMPKDDAVRIFFAQFVTQ